MSQEKLQEILQLPYDEKMEIYEALMIDLSPEDDELTEAQKQELDRRIKAVESGEAKLIPWEEIKKKYGMK